MKQILITIRPDGSTAIDAQGFGGVGCTDATKGMELVLTGGKPPTDRDYKPDFYATTGNTGTLHQ